MRTGYALVSLLAGLAVVASACTAAPLPTPSEGPSQFLKGFNLPAVVASINSTRNGPRCPGAPPVMSSSAINGWSTAGITISCTDPGDGTALAQGWAAGITAELGRLGAGVDGKGVGTTETGEEVTGEWWYTSSGLRGQITVLVLAAPEGRYWTIVRMFEPS